MHGCCRRGFAAVATCSLPCLILLLILLIVAFPRHTEAFLPGNPAATDRLQVAKAGENSSRTPSPRAASTKRATSSAKSPSTSRSRVHGRPRITHRSVRTPYHGSSPRVRRYSYQDAMLRRWAFTGFLNRRGTEGPRLLETWKIRLVDGDTFWYGGERIRIRGYDAPERSEPGGFQATQRLELLLHEGQVRIVPLATDSYGRTVADVYVDQRNIAEVMTAEGYTKKR